MMVSKKRDFDLPKEIIITSIFFIWSSIDIYEDKEKVLCSKIIPTCFISFDDAVRIIQLKCRRATDAEIIY